MEQKTPESSKHVVYCLDLAEDETCTSWRIAYIGETYRGEQKRGEEEHKRQVGGASRPAASVGRHGPNQHRVRVMAVVHDEEERKALETYLMLKHNTLFRNAGKMRDLYAYKNREKGYWNPDISLEGEPRNFQLNQMRSMGNKHQKIVDRAGEKYEAKKTKGTLTCFTVEEEEAIFETIDADLAKNEGVTERVQHVLVARRSSCNEQLVSLDSSTPFGRARELRDQYKDLPPGDVVDRNTVSAELQSIGERPLYQLKEPDKNVMDMIKLWQKCVHPNNQLLVGKKLTAAYVVPIFELAFQWCGDYEDSEIADRLREEPRRKGKTDTLKFADFYDNFKEYRSWTESNMGIFPKGVTEDSEEQRIAKTFVYWRSDQKQIHQAIFLVVMRHHPGFVSAVTGRRGGGRKGRPGSNETHARVKKLLQGGFGFMEKGRISIPSTCPECGVMDKAYTFMSGFCNGGAPESGVFLQSIVNPIFTQERYESFKARHDSKRDSFFEKCNRSADVQRIKLGRQPKRKNLASSSSSSSAPAPAPLPIPLSKKQRGSPSCSTEDAPPELDSEPEEDDDDHPFPVSRRPVLEIESEPEEG